MNERSGNPAPSSGSGEMQGFLTLKLPMRRPAHAEAFRHELRSAFPALGTAAGTLGTIHYFRFFQLDPTTFYLLAEYDGAQDRVLADLARHFGPALDPLVRYVGEVRKGVWIPGPPTPLADNIDAFVAWAKPLCVESFTEYSGYPGASVKQIRSLAADAGIEFDEGTGDQRALLLLMPMKTRVSATTLKGALHFVREQMVEKTDRVGTVHFARLVEVAKKHVGFFTAFDGPSFEKYGQDFAEHLGESFDLLFKFLDNPGPSPAAKHVPEFVEWAFSINLVPIVFWSAYPGLTVQDVKALVADAAAVAG